MDAFLICLVGCRMECSERISLNSNIFQENVDDILIVTFLLNLCAKGDCKCFFHFWNHKGSQSTRSGNQELKLLESPDDQHTRPRHLVLVRVFPFMGPPQPGAHLESLHFFLFCCLACSSKIWKGDWQCLGSHYLGSCHQATSLKPASQILENSKSLNHLNMC